MQLPTQRSCNGASQAAVPGALRFRGAFAARHRSRNALSGPAAPKATAVEEKPSAAVSPTGGEDAAAALQQSRKYLSLLPPFFSRETTMTELGPGLWGLVQPLKPPGQADIRLRMTCATLSDGSLVVIGPVAPTQEVLNMLQSMGGPVKHIVVPNTSPEHWLFAPSLANAFPSATLWTVPGFFQGKGVPLPGRSLLFTAARKRGQCATLGVDPYPAELQSDLQTVLFDVPFFMEAALCLTRHRVLMLADTAVALSASDPEYANMGATGIELAKRIELWDRLGPVTKVVFERYTKEGKAWVEEVLESCDFDMIVPAHGSAPIGERGDAGAAARKAFKDCFGFLFV